MIKESFLGDNIPISYYLSQIIEEAKSKYLSLEDRIIIRQHLLDAIACAFIGRRGRLFKDFLRICKNVSEGSGLPGCGKLRVVPPDASMIWAFAIHASVFEDGSREGACHPSAAVIPAVVTLSRGRDWEEIDRAIYAGYEVMIRISRSGNPKFTQRGFHPTSITAPFGCVAAASLLLKYDLQTAQNAFSLSAMGSSGLIASFREGGSEPLQVSWAVRNGIISTILAGLGHRGYPNIFEEGFFPAFLGSFPPFPLDKPLKYENSVRGCYLKPYPGCRHIHPSIDGIATILKERKIDISKIDRINVRTYRVAIETEIHHIKSREDAYFNIPYAISSRIILGKSDWDTFDERNFLNPEILELMGKVTVSVDDELESLYPEQRGAIVEIFMKNGEMFSKRVNYPLGEPENPIPISFTYEKFRNASRNFLSDKSIERIETILNVSNPSGSPEQLFMELYGEGGE